MRILDGPWRRWQPPQRPSSLTVGVLDGVHRGHRELISRLRTESMDPTVLTFDPHPVAVLAPGHEPPLLTTVEERLLLLGRLGVEQVGVLDLAEIRDLDPVDFVDEVLLGRMRMKHLVVGVDFRFGRDRTGDTALLTGLATSRGFSVELVELVSQGEEPVSSSRIRRLLEEGRPHEAAELLGSWYRLTGTVVEGEGRGEGLGFPTVNLATPPRKLIPGTGVYACFATVDHATLEAAVNVGVRPTFGGGDLLVEAHLIDYSGRLYGEEVTLEFVRYLRPELHFDRVEDLVSQMERDVAETRQVLAAASDVV